MNDFQGLLSSDYGFKPQGKAAPMAPPKSTTNSSSNSAFNFEIGGSKPSSFSSNVKNPSSSSSFLDDHDNLFRPNRKPSPDDFGSLDDEFFGNRSNSSKSTNNPVNLDSIFGGGGGGGGGDSGPRFSSLPVFDKPVYDEDGPSSAKFENIFSSSSSAKKVDAFDDLLGGLGKKENQSSRSVGVSKGADKGMSSFDDLLPGFGGGSTTSRNSSDASKKTSTVIDDPFVVLESTSPPVSSSSGIYNDPLEEISNLNNTGRTVENSSGGTVFDDIDPLGGFSKAVPAFSAEINVGEKDASPLGAGARASGRQTSVSGDARQKSSVRSPERGFEKTMPVEDHVEPSYFEMPSVSAETSRSAPSASSPVHSNASFRESNSHGHTSPSSEENMGSSDDIWLSVSEIPLFTQPTTAAPPSRPPPPRPARFSRGESGSFPASNAHKKVNDYAPFAGSVPNFQSPKSAPSGARGSFASPVDELEEFAMGGNRSNVDTSSDVRSGEDFDSNSVAAASAAASAAAMKEAMDRAEAKFRHARGVRERENAKASRSKEFMQEEKEEKPTYDAPERDFREHERLEREQQQREREEEERGRREEDERRRIEKEWEEKEREKRRVDRERELGRQAVERAAKEARERAAIEARTRAERVAVQRAHAEARERAERAAVQRAQAEARERAAAGAKERAEKAAAEAREKAKAEAREKEAREKEARERAATAARVNQQKNENDLESFFSMGSRASSAPRPRATSSDPFETQFQSKPAPEAARASASSSSMRKASSSTNIVDDLSSIFGGPPSSGDFPEVDGETDDRRKARMERHHRTQERAAKALAEKNARDLEAQREQTERHRFAESLDAEIRRWAAGKEGNLRALLSTLQYVLWPECGWQPVSLTDLITGASVKKVYRKATLCIHPDKVQQKGATLQQKYVAEKVFDLLKEAWNKFNSEELF